MYINDKGVTLVELLISLAIFSTILGLSGAAYVNSLKSSVHQRELSQMNHNLRATLDLMSHDIKLAGLDPSGKADAQILIADKHRMVFSLDRTGGLSDGEDNDDDGTIDEGVDGADNNGNGYTDEQDEAEWYDGKTDGYAEYIKYVLSNDADNDGLNDGLPTENATGEISKLVRILDHPTDSIEEIVASNIDALNFVYLDENGNELFPTTTPADIVNIVSIQLSIVTRVSSNMYITPNNTSYTNQQGATFFPNQNDDIRRKMTSVSIFCRNIALSN